VFLAFLIVSEFAEFSVVLGLEQYGILVCLGVIDFGYLAVVSGSLVFVGICAGL